MKTNEKSFFNIHNIVYCGLGGFCERFLKMLIHMLCFTFKAVLLFACFSFDLNFFIYLYTVTLFTSTSKVFFFNSTVTCLLSSTVHYLPVQLLCWQVQLLHLHVHLLVLFLTSSDTLLICTVTLFTCTVLHIVKKATVKKISILFIYIFLEYIFYWDIL